MTDSETNPVAFTLQRILVINHDTKNDPYEEDINAVKKAINQAEKGFQSIWIEAFKEGVRPPDSCRVLIFFGVASSQLADKALAECPNQKIVLFSNGISRMRIDVGGITFLNTEQLDESIVELMKI